MRPITTAITQSKLRIPFLAAMTGLFTLTLIAFIAPVQAHEDVGVLLKDGWARASIGAAKTSAIYITLDNSHGPDDKLLEVRSDAAKAVEIHSMSMTDGVMKMRRMDYLALPHGETVKLAPGGWHIMLIGLKNPLSVGGSVDATFVFEKAGEKTVTLPIHPIGGPDKSGAGHKMPAPSGHEMPAPMDHSKH